MFFLHGSKPLLGFGSQTFRSLFSGENIHYMTMTGWMQCPWGGMIVMVPKAEAHNLNF